MFFFSALVLFYRGFASLLSNYDSGQQRSLTVKAGYFTFLFGKNIFYPEVYKSENIFDVMLVYKTNNAINQYGIIL